METNQLGCELTITEPAAHEFMNMCMDEGRDKHESYLRVGAHAGGCSGWKFTLDYDDEELPTDLLFKDNMSGVKMIVDEEILNTILGDVEIDFRKGNLVERGFMFRRTKLAHTCGCGESFTPVKDIKE
jgi:iron-sulfur cluster assembly protein